MSPIAALAISVWTVVVCAFSQGATPTAQPAIDAILAAFDRYNAVGMNAAHSNEKQDEFIFTLIRHPDFARKVNDVVVECGNREYQPLLDRFIAGDDIPLGEARRVWRTTAVRMCALSGFYDTLFPAIRALNRDLPNERRLRVLVCESGTLDRNQVITSVMTTEVLAKHRKALMLIGVGHLWHGEARGTAVSAYEKTYPGRTLVIDTHNGFAAFFDLARGRELEARMQSWPIPSFVTVKGSWLADLDLPYFLWPFPKRLAGVSYADLVDAYLYLGPGASLTYERTPDTILDDHAYLADVSGRLGAIDVDAMRRRNQDRALFTSADRAEARQFAPGAECVGTYMKQGGDTPMLDVDFRGGILSARWAGSKEWTMLKAAGGRTKYQLVTPDGTLTLDFEVAASSAERVTVVQSWAPYSTVTLFARLRG
jgi:hypothetical protein